MSQRNRNESRPVSLSALLIGFFMTIIGLNLAFSGEFFGMMIGLYGMMTLYQQFRRFSIRRREENARNYVERPGDDSFLRSPAPMSRARQTRDEDGLPPLREEGRALNDNAAPGTRRQEPPFTYPMRQPMTPFPPYDERNDHNDNTKTPYRPYVPTPRGAAGPSLSDLLSAPNTGEPFRAADGTLADRGYQHALEASQRAGLNTESAPVIASDIGVIAVSGSEQAIFRERGLPTTVESIQPFVSVSVPQTSQGVIRFEIEDGDGQLLLRTEVQASLAPNTTNLISAPARVRLHSGSNRSQGWTMRVYGGGILLAQHAIVWENQAAARASGMRQHLGDDGEISEAMQAALARNRLEDMSLNDLLNAPPPDRAARRSEQGE